MAQLSNSHTSSDHQEVFHGLRVQLKPAPPLKRVLAYAVDLGVVLAILYPALIVLGVIGAILVGGAAAVGGALGDRGATSVVVVGLVIIALLALLSVTDLYFIVQERRRATTLGKHLSGLRVVSLDGRALTTGQIVLRGLMRYVDCILLLPGILSMASNAQRRRLGDLMAGTMVVHSEAREREGTFLYLTGAEYSRLELMLLPRPLPESDAKNLQQFVFRRERDAHASTGEDSQWRAYLRQYVGDTGAFEGLQDQQILRFFAERCLQNQHRAE